MSLSPPSCSQKLVSGGQGSSRPRVVLQQGRSLMDWISVTARKCFASQRVEYVDEVELSKHNKVDDCWILLSYKVYDVTKYLDFHPGGVDELMRAAGCDGTALFNELHRWVNYEGLLESCYVGEFRGDRRKLKPPKPPLGSEPDVQFGSTANPLDPSAME